MNESTEYKKNRKITIYGIFGFFLTVSLFISLFLFLYIYLNPTKRDLREVLDDRNYHVLVVGTYENQHFLKQVYEGASNISSRYNILVELYVPDSYAQNSSLQDLLDYASYVSADGVIAYVDNPDELISVPMRTDGTLIPFVTVGQYASSLPQVSYIGASYWEIGKRIAEECVSYLNGIGNVYYVSDETNTSANYSNLLNSFQSIISKSEYINFTQIKTVLSQPQFAAKYPSILTQNSVFVCMSESETIDAAQTLSTYNIKNVGLIGFGNNEIVQNLYKTGGVTELISVDPKKIGEQALIEMFEYRTNGYANNYITAEITVKKSRK